MENVEIILGFLKPRNLGSGYGYGSGYGSGYGDGYGYGYGDGSGYGSGYGSGSGDGSGDGSGYGSGYGSGDGDGSGDGYGSGYGDGDGSGYGYKEFNHERVWYIDGVPTLIDLVRGYDYAYGRIIRKDMTTEKCYIVRVGNSFAHGKTLREAANDAQEKEMRDMPVEERIELFIQKYPTLEAKDKGSEFFRWHNTLTGSCRMGREEFVKDRGIDLEKEYTVDFFLDITKESYGGPVIKQLLSKYLFNE